MARKRRRKKAYPGSAAYMSKYAEGVNRGIKKMLKKIEKLSKPA